MSKKWLKVPHFEVEESAHRKHDRKRSQERRQERKERHRERQSTIIDGFTIKQR